MSARFTTARLLPAEISDLNRLYDLGFTSWLPAEAVAQGVYHGVRIGGRLVAAAGTHVVSSQARLAAVGNVMTHRDYRNRGLAALAAYRALGYREHVRFEERLAHRRGSGWDSIVSPFRRFFLARKES